MVTVQMRSAENYTAFPGVDMAPWVTLPMLFQETYGFISWEIPILLNELIPLLVLIAELIQIFKGSDA